MGGPSNRRKRHEVLWRGLGLQKEFVTVGILVRPQAPRSLDAEPLRNEGGEDEKETRSGKKRSTSRRWQRGRRRRPKRARSDEEEKGGESTTPPLERKGILLLAGRRNLISFGCVRRSRSSEEEERKGIAGRRLRRKVGVIKKSGQRLGERRARDGEGPSLVKATVNGDIDEVKPKRAQQNKASLPPSILNELSGRLRLGRAGAKALVPWIAAARALA